MKVCELDRLLMSSHRAQAVPLILVQRQVQLSIMLQIVQPDALLHCPQQSS